MRINSKDYKDNLELILDWNDIQNLKEGKEICTRYNGEHKINLSCIPQTLNFTDLNWVNAESYKPISKFDAFLHDFFISISIFDIRNQFISASNIKLEKNPFNYKSVRIVYPV